MLLGGRLIIELATVVVDRMFLAQYPNVRPGAHVLITVTEARRPARPVWPIGRRNQPTGASANPSSSDSPGVDLGALQRLIRDCGGHLWMTAERSGDMLLKIHLPQHVVDSATDPPTRSTRSDRGRSMARWFRN
jgi:hypothetical protein